MVRLFPCGKINLGLNIIEKRPDGYHNLETVFYPVDIHDELIVEKTEREECCLSMQGTDFLCSPEQNLIVKAYHAVNERHPIPGVKATLVKKLPSQAGMGGGSSDGAYMIRALNELFSLGMTIGEMKEIAAGLGADCPFFIEATPAYAEGIGERLSSVNKSDIFNNADDLLLVLIKPDVAVSTKEAYAGISPCKPQHNCRDIVCSMPIEKWREALKNDFEKSIFQKLPILSEVKETLYAHGALYAAMSGSGSTLFGIFRTDEACKFKTTDSIEKIKKIYGSKYYFQIVKI